MINKIQWFVKNIFLGFFKKKVTQGHLFNN